MAIFKCVGYFIFICLKDSASLLYSVSNSIINNNLLGFKLSGTVSGIFGSGNRNKRKKDQTLRTTGSFCEVVTFSSSTLDFKKLQSKISSQANLKKYAKYEEFN
jgi:hypothetical protein